LQAKLKTLRTQVGDEQRAASATMAMRQKAVEKREAQLAAELAERYVTMTD